jgi:hypothetical protein
VLDEIGIDLSAALAGTSAPARRVAAPAAGAAAEEPALGDELTSRLAQLRS